MKPWIERYIYAVTKRLPESSRQEVHNELLAHINDMLGENPTEEEISTVLHTLGQPAELANKYRGKDRYVVHPVLYEDYLNVLKIVGIVFITVQLITGSISLLTTFTYSTFWNAVGTITGTLFGNMFSGLFSAAGVITLVFWGLSHNETFHTTDWKLHDLPDLPEPTTEKITRLGVMVELVITTILSLVWVVVLMEGLIIVDGSIPFFNQPLVTPYVYLYSVGILLNILTLLWKLRMGSWSFKVAIPDVVEKIYSSVIGILFINIPGLINPAIYTLIADNTEYSAATVQQGFATGIYWITIVIVVATMIDIVTTLVKGYKGSCSK